MPPLRPLTLPSRVACNFPSSVGYGRSIIRSQSTASSVSANEISHFSALASSWWDPHGSSRFLHLMNPVRHDFIASCLTSSSTSPLPNTLKYVDIGCGGGIFTESAARLPTTRSAIGLDPSSSVLEIAKAHARQDPLLTQSARLTYLNKPIEELPVPETEEQQFDILTLFEVLEHVSSPSAFLSSCLPFVKPGGWIIGSTIARTWTSWLVTKVVAEAPVVGVVPVGTHDWNKYINPTELEDWFLKQREWERMKKMGVPYVPGLGWKMVDGGDEWGNYFFGVRKRIEG